MTATFSGEVVTILVLGAPERTLCTLSRVRERRADLGRGEPER